MSASSASSHVVALDTSQVKSLGLGAIIVIVLVGLAIAYFVTKVVTKIITIVLVVILGFALYNQRQKVLDAIDQTAKKCDVTFFGIHVQPSDANIKKACAEVAKQQGK
ncbi:MAG: hypothetical protein QOE71_668 [Pseudonocardiales bacterium]|jgi:uncharacterized membrane protein YebE (DUF533 family)|nr:hypothetical protein [Pseudonocardiales bacterium]